MLDNINDARAHAAFLRGLSGQSDFAEDRAAFAEIAEFLEHIVAGRLVVRTPRPTTPDDETAASAAAEAPTVSVEVDPSAAAATPVVADSSATATAAETSA